MNLPCLMTDPPRRDRETMESLELVRDAQEGDQEALDRLFERYYHRTLILVRARMGSKLRDEVESGDLVNEALIQAIRSFKNFEIRDKAGLVKWFAQIVENRIRGVARYNRRDKRDRAREVPLDAPPPGASQVGYEPSAHQRSPLSDVVGQEEGRLLRETLDSLAPRHRAVITLRHEEGLTWEEVARRIESPSADAARMSYQRALIELKKRLPQD